MSIDVDPFSRFAQTETVSTEEGETFGKWVEPDVLVNELPEDAIRRYTTPSALEGRPDRISQVLYNTTHLDWLIVALNGTRDVLNWPRAGDVIKTLEPSLARDLIQ